MHTTIRTTPTSSSSSSSYSNNNHISSKHNHHSDHENPTDLPTPPPSPIRSQQRQHSMTATLEANSRILTAKREGNLKAVMAEFGSMKKQHIPLTHHTYNLVLDAHANLRREGTPLTNIFKSK